MKHWRSIKDTVKFITHVGQDGILKLELPVDVTNSDLEVTLTLVTIEHQLTDRNGWPLGYFDSTYGSLAHNPIERGEQGQFEIREPLT